MLQGISVCAPGGAPVDGVELADVVISAVDRVGIWGMATEGLVLSAVEVTEVVASGEPLDAAAMTCGPLDTVDAFGVLLHGCIGVLLEGVVVGEVDGGSGSPGICTAVKEIDGTDGGDAVGIKLQGCDGFSMSQCEVQGLSGGDGGDGAYDWSPGPGGSWYTTCDGGDGGDAIGFLSTGGACSASDWTATGLSPGVGGGFPWGTGPCSGFSCPQPGVDGQGLVSLGLDGCT